eukprot:3150974-Amphidinium_carterae.1
MVYQDRCLTLPPQQGQPLQIQIVTDMCLCGPHQNTTAQRACSAADLNSNGQCANLSKARSGSRLCLRKLVTCQVQSLTQ